MGIFDFTYADNGSNIRGQRGYLYLTNHLVNKTRLPNPLPFRETDAYGKLSVKLKPNLPSMDLDIFAMLSLMLYLDYPDIFQAYIQDKRRTTTILDGCDKLIDLLKSSRKTAPDPDKLEDLQYLIRDTAIHYWYADCYNHKPKPAWDVTVPPLAGQRTKQVTCHKYCNHPVPLLVTRKKLHLQGDLSDIAEQWGFVTGPDPEQGTRRTINLYYPYEKFA